MKLTLDPEATELSLPGKRAAERYDDAQLAALAQLTKLDRVWLGRQNITRLPAMPPSITRLSVTGTTDLASLAGIESLVRVQRLSLRDLPALDLADALDRIAELPELTELEIAGRALTLPANIAKLPSVVRVSLAGVDLADACTKLAKLATLRNLHVTGELPDAIGDLVRLEVLSAYETRTLPRSIGKLRALRELKFVRSKLLALPDEVCDLASLEVLDLEWTLIKALPAQFGRLAKLRVLSLDHTKLRALPRSFGELASLRELRMLFLPKRPAVIVPDSFSALKLENFTGPDHLAAKLTITPPDTFDGEILHLHPGDHVPREFDPRRLTIRMPDRTEPFPQLSQLRRVEEVTLDVGDLGDALERLASAPRLRELTIDGVRETLPETIGKLVQLTSLRIDNEDEPSLKRLPDLSALTNLDELVIQFCPIAELPALPPVRELTLRMTKLVRLPEGLRVRELVLGGGELDLAPLVTWPALRKLDLGGGPYALDKLLGKLTALEDLDLRGLAMKRLPPGIGALAKLQRLDLRKVKLDALPAELRACTKLAWFGKPRIDGIEVKDFLPPGRWKKTDRSGETFYERST